MYIKFDHPEDGVVFKTIPFGNTLRGIKYKEVKPCGIYFDYQDLSEALGTTASDIEKSKHYIYTQIKPINKKHKSISLIKETIIPNNIIGEKHVIKTRR